MHVNSDNMTTVFNKEAMHVLRCLSFILAKFQLTIIAEHNIPGAYNDIADALSRNELALFRSLLPQARAQPIPIPKPLLDLVISDRLNWTSPH